MKLPIFATGLLLAFGAHAGERHAELTVERSLQIALQNHRSLAVSQANVDLAEAQYRQAMAAFGPRLNVETGYQRADEDRTYNFSGTVQTPSMTLPIGPGGSLVTLPGQPLPMDMEVKLFDRDVSRAALNFNYPLYAGGRGEALASAAQRGLQIAREGRRKTELEVARDIRKYYHGAQLAQKMEQLASDTLERFKLLEDLTERLFQNSSLKVKKTDYLRSKTTTAVARTMFQDARYAAALSRDALVNAMGLPAGSEISLAAESGMPAFDGALDALVADAMRFNPDRQRVALAIEAAEFRIDEARGSQLPVIGIDASTYRIWNDYDGGLFNKDNRSGWTIGIGLKWDVFDGGLARAGVDAARAERMKLDAQRVLLDDALALQIKDGFLRIHRSRTQIEEGEKAQGFAEENRKLHQRAYQHEMVDTKDVIEAQIVESFAAASLYRAQHELRVALADLDYLIGRAVRQGDTTGQ
jgi:outer membrane protein TolC